MKPNDGGPAFPQPNHLIDTERGREQARGWMEDSGMTLRDWFAGQALIMIVHREDGKNMWLDDLAEGCYRYADAMLKAREK